MRSRVWGWAERTNRADTGAWALAVGGAWAVFLLTAHWATGQVNDSVAAVWPAWQFVHTGSFDLARAVGLPDNIWFTPLDGRVVSQRMMGVVLAGIPFAAAAPWLGPEQVGALAGASYSALAVGNMHLLLRALAPARLAALATLVFALGSPLWTTGAAELWPHGVDACFVTAGLLGLQRQRYVLAGLAMAPAVMTRPYLAVSAALLGAVLAWTRRRPALLVAFGVSTAVSIPLLLLWNDWYYGTANVGGPYQAHVGTSLAGPGPGALEQLGRDLGGALLSPEVGLVCYSPVVAVLLVRLVPAWRDAPDWVRASALAGCAYELLQLKGNRYSGGGAFYSNRLAVELVVLLTPLLLCAVLPLVQQRTRWTTPVVALAATSVGVHLFGALSSYHWLGTVQHWWLWYPWHVARTWGWGSLPLALAAAAVPVLAVLLVRQEQDEVVIPAQRASRSAEPRVRS